MAKQVLLMSYLNLAGNDLSAACSKIELTVEMEEKDSTTFGSGGAKENLGGLESGSLSLAFKNDYDAAAIDSIMWTLMKTRTPQTFRTRPNQAPVGAANPEYSGKVLIKEWKPINGSVGDLAEVDVSYPTSGPTERATA